MLLKLFIENYALIHKLEIEWREGFSVITGETGAGKTILLGALSLILGQRAEAGVLFDKETKCIVEGTFRISTYGLESYFDQNELDFCEMLVLRREVAPTGKSRAFINDTPVNLVQLKELGDRLVNIHSQHSITTLNQANFQMEILDDYASTQNLVGVYREEFKLQESRLAELSRISETEARIRGESGYYQFLFDELDKASLAENEQTELEEKLTVLTHAGEIKKELESSLHLLETADTNLLSILNDILHSIRTVSSFYQEISLIGSRLETNLIDIKDITKELRRLEDKLDVDPEATEKITLRLDLIYRLERKHQVSSVSDLIRVRDELAGKIRETGSLDERISSLSSEISAAAEALIKKARIISDSRIRAIPSFESEIIYLLKELGMPSACFTIECKQSETCNEDGIDSVRFLFSANRGIPPDEIQKIASGGELSRLMLSVKSMIGRKNLLPTIVFDEIDNGVSGEIAGKVGTILKRMSGTMQVIVITHLPQIAGKGDLHYWVFKEDTGGTVRSSIRKLSRDERIEEIAKMVSGDRLTEAAFLAAKELLVN